MAKFVQVFSNQNILDIEDTVDKFDLRKHIITSVECTGASWDEGRGEWAVGLRDHRTGLDFVRYATIFVSAVGAISFPRDVKFKGMDRFRGPIVHTARWDHSIDYTGKRVVCVSPAWCRSDGANLANRQ